MLTSLRTRSFLPLPCATPWSRGHFPVLQQSHRGRGRRNPRASRARAFLFLSRRIRRRLTPWYMRRWPVPWLASLQGSILSSIFAFTSDGRVKSAKWRDWLNRVIRPKSKRHAFLQELRPGVGSGSALGAQPVHSPVHIGKKMIGLHGSNHF